MNCTFYEGKEKVRCLEKATWFFIQEMQVFGNNKYNAYCKRHYELISKHDLKLIETTENEYLTSQIFER